MAGIGFDFQGARNAGYSDADIVQHLASDPNVKFDVGGAMKSGYSPSEIITHLSDGTATPPKSTSYIDAAKQGVSNVLGGVGETLNTYGPEGSGNGLANAAKSVAPENYQQAKVVGEGGGLSQLPRAVVESAPGMAGSIAAARLMPGPAWLKLLAGSGAYALQTLGNRAKSRAYNNTGDENAAPTTSDKIAAAASEIPEAAVGAIGLGRFLPGAGAVRSVGARGVIDAAGQLARTALTEGATAGTQNAIGQLGSTLGTKRGASVDPSEVANAAIVGGTTGGVMAAPKALGEMAGAVKYRSFGGANDAASSSVANDIQTKAGGQAALDPTLLNGKGKKAFDAVSRVDAENALQLKQQVSDLKQTTPLAPDAENALALAASGKPLTADDHTAIDRAVAGAPNGDLVSFLARKASVLANLKNQGNYDTSKGKFTGGMSGPMFSILSPHNITKTAIAGLAGEGAGVHMIAYSPYALGALGGAGLGARVIDRMTGNLSPAARFAKRFADPTVQPPAVNQPLPSSAASDQSAGPWGPTPPQPSVPSVAQPPVPPTRVPPGYGSVLQAAVRNINKQQKGQDQRTISQTMPLIRKLAAKEALKGGAQMLGDAIGGPLGGHLAYGVASILTELRDHGENGPTSPVSLPQPQQQVLQKVANGPLGPGGVPVSILNSTKALTRGLQTIQKAKQTQQGNDYADAVAARSPLVAKVGGPNVIANPVAGKRMSEMVGALNAYNKLATGANSVLDQQKEKPETPHPGGTDQEWPPRPKAVEGYQIPSSPYAHLPVPEAAKNIARDAETAGNVKYISGFRSATMRNLTAIRTASAGLAKEVPALDAKTVAAQFEGASSQKAAIAHREWLKTKVPEAADALNTYFSDDVINRIWKRKG